MTDIPHEELELRLRELEARQGTMMEGLGLPIFMGGCTAGMLFLFPDQSPDVGWIAWFFLAFVGFIRMLLRWHALRVEIQVLRRLLSDFQSNESSVLTKVRNAA